MRAADAAAMDMRMNGEKRSLSCVWGHFVQWIRGMRWTRVGNKNRDSGAKVLDSHSEDELKIA